MDDSSHQTGFSEFTDYDTRAYPQKRELISRYEPTANSALSLIAGEFAGQIISICGPNRIHEYFLASDQRRHIWHSWLGSNNRQIFEPDTYRFLTSSRSKQIVADVYGSCPAGLVPALGRLGPQARRKEFYSALFSVLAKGGPLATHIHHLKQISEETIFALAAINDHPPSDRVLTVLLKRSKPHRLAELVWIVSRLTLLMGGDEVENSIVTGGNPARAVEKLVGLLPFPDSPFPSDPRLQPITTAIKLREVGKEFRNCLADQRTWFDAVIEVQAGRTYFYRWNGYQPSLLSFSRDLFC